MCPKPPLTPSRTSSSGLRPLPAAAHVVSVRGVRKPTIGEEQVPLRTFLLNGVLRFTMTVGGLPGVSMIALMGSLATRKVSPKDADVLVTLAADSSLDRLAKASRALKSYAQTRNSGADIFLADRKGQYIGRVCHWRDSPARHGAVARESSSTRIYRL
jgi:hypothetical protein